MIAKSDEHGIDEQMTKNKETRKATHFQPTSSHFTSPFANHFGTLKFPSNAAVPTWAIRIQSSMIEWATGKIFLVKKKKNIEQKSSPTCSPFEFIYFDSSSAAVKWLLLWQLASHSAANRLREVGEVLEHHKEAWEVGPVIILAQYSSNQRGKITKSRENSSECEPAIIRLWHPR